MFKPHTICRACGNNNLVPVVDLGCQPLANDYVFNELDIVRTKVPLVVLFCENCTLAQLSVVVEPDILYNERYAYVQQSKTKTIDAHFKKLANDIAGCGGYGPVLEIGSNDGAFLKFLSGRGMPCCLGIDPSASGSYDFIRAPFNMESAKEATHGWCKFGIIIARHVFAHIDNWKSFMEALVEVAHDDALIVIEVPYVPDLLFRNEWSSIYHEHLSYVTEKSLRMVITPYGFAIQRAIRYDVHGGSVAFMIRRGKPTSSTPSECSIHQWKGLNELAAVNAITISQFVREVRDQGKVVCGYGAPAKATVICHCCKFTSEQIAFVTDTTPNKIGCHIPGTDIPVVHPREMEKRKPDYAVMFAWNYADEIISRESANKGHRVKLIIPHTLKVI